MSHDDPIDDFCNDLSLLPHGVRKWFLTVFVVGSPSLRELGFNVFLPVFEYFWTFQFVLSFNTFYGGHKSSTASIGYLTRREQQSSGCFIQQVQLLPPSHCPANWKHLRYPLALLGKLSRVVVSLN
ncbi:hypothetical protein TNCV_345971 [Trichonephila clavipes]|nr:hypothetical protein TNCV_345971 [Trichonephila clavipes]